MLRLPDGRGKRRQIGEVVQETLARLRKQSHEQPEDQSTTFPDPDEVERLASVIRQQAESQAQNTRKRLWEAAQDGDLDDPYVKELLVDVFEENEQIPAFYEALFRRHAERMAQQAEEEIEVIEGVAKPLPNSETDESKPSENKE